MSTLNVSNITDGTTTVGTSYVVNGSAKAWMSLNGTGTIAIRDSLNISSVTDNATGGYTQNFTNSFSNGNYSTNVTGTHDGGSYVSWGVVANDTPPATTAFRGDYLNAASTPADVSYAQTSSFGDLA